MRWPASPHRRGARVSSGWNRSTLTPPSRCPHQVQHEGRSVLQRTHVHPDCAGLVAILAFDLGMAPLQDVLGNPSSETAMASRSGTRCRKGSGSPRATLEDGRSVDRLSGAPSTSLAATCETGPAEEAPSSAVTTPNETTTLAASTTVATSCGIPGRVPVERRAADERRRRPMRSANAGSRRTCASHAVSDAVSPAERAFRARLRRCRTAASDLPRPTASSAVVRSSRWYRSRTSRSDSSMAASAARSRRWA